VIGSVVANLPTSRYVYEVNPDSGSKEAAVNRGVIGTIIGVLVIIVLVLVIMNLM